MNAIEIMIRGYAELNKKDGEELEVIQKDNPDERELITIEKLIAGYGKDGLQKNQETKLNVMEDDK
ncbi:hypothetical protein [Bacillus subtilis]|uniref:hypothetical protein n=1 Tax=Bacillus subtilis TaxID=1423 RepID=UPI0026769D0D|nr:hypothetical protein [Bacillus subtilis]MDO3653545.1 hypothetical protein [Bacillus subtilis]